jgi:solute carrier family 35 protein F3/4
MDGTNSKSLGPVVLVAAAAIAFAIYKVFYQRMIGYVSYGEMTLFFTLIGLLTGFLIWPLVLLLYLTSSEMLTWNTIPWIPLSSAALLNFIANFLSFVGINWTYEIFLSFGVLLAIPISLVIDATVYNVVFKGMKLGGILLIMIGFLVVLLPDNWNQYLADVMRSKLSKWKRPQKTSSLMTAPPGKISKNGTKVQDTTTAQLSRLRTPSGRVK